MKLNYKVRLGNKNDFDELAKLRLEYLSNNSSYNNNSFNKKFKNYLNTEIKLKRLKVYIAEKDNEIIGNIYFIIIPKTPNPTSKKDKIGYITNAYIKKSYRNNKIGSKIIKDIIKYSKQNNFDLVIVWPSKKSKSFYQKLNFKNKNDIHELLF
jgi:ribosomal protein S18 acetylase RimI-like enzyme